MTPGSARQLLYLLQVSNSYFPTGTFNHSYGFETWIDGKAVHDGASLELTARDWLLYGVAPADGAAVAWAHRATMQDDLAAIIDLDHQIGSVKLTRETREASAKTGRALLNAIADVFAPDALNSYTKAVRQGDCDGHYAVVFGTAAAAAGVAEEETVLVYLQSSLANLAAVAARLIPLGQFETQRIIRRAWPLLLLATAAARDMPLNMLGAATAGLDVASMQHERLYTRLCMS